MDYNTKTQMSITKYRERLDYLPFKFYFERWHFFFFFLHFVSAFLIFFFFFCFDHSPLKLLGSKAGFFFFFWFELALKMGCEDKDGQSQGKIVTARLLSANW